MQCIKRLYKDEKGLEMVEYAVLAALIVIAVVVAVPNLAAGLIAMYTGLATWLSSQAAAIP